LIDIIPLDSYLASFFFYFFLLRVSHSGLQALLDALTKGQNDPDTLVNLICCYQHMAKSEEVLQR
jgi:hypothetical protein